MPHDCKQDDFPFGPLKSPRILNRLNFCLSTNLEMILIYLKSSPNELMKFLMKACQGPGRKDSLRRKHRREFRFL